MITGAKNLLGISVKTLFGISAKTALGIGAKTALGIDISNNQISMALVKKSGNTVKLLKAVNAAVPDGAIKNGIIEKPTTIAKAIKKLKTNNKIHASHVILSPPVNSILTQIMDMPNQISTNIKQFVKDEVKHYIVLADKNITSDFFAINHGLRLNNNRLFVAAADTQELNELTRAIIQTDINLEVIEPSLLACIRAFYAKKISAKFGCNILLAILQDCILNICVFRDRTLDFVRTKNFATEKYTPEEFCHCLTEQINTVIQFYDIEVPGGNKKWEVSVTADNSIKLPPNAEESLKTNIPNTNLLLRASEDAWQDTAASDSIEGVDEKPSPVAIGLAMKFLDTTQSNLKINLIPPEIIEIRATIKQALITAGIVITILLTMMTVTTGPVRKKAGETVAKEHRAQLSSATYALLEEHKLLDKKIRQLSDNINEAQKIAGLRQNADWPRLFNDIKNGIPKAVQITGLSSQGDSKISLEGAALSYKAINLFVDILNKSELISSASLVKTEKNETKDSFVKYTIECSLAERKGT